ncbi:MAG TPA: glycosyltransferase family 39 protein, partial [Flavobacteriales bacterium]|nr:glycosyltransferase family 39 protein [Flavobacteriales bacterium]
MFASYFTSTQQGILLFAVLLGIAALLLQVRERHRAALIALTLAAFALRLFAAWLDPFLNDWDEAYHAVVAKNLMAHPFTPMLYTQAAMPTTTLWSEQHYWLHKPPFFLWQIALSLKIFGLHPWAVRLPSVFWLTVLVPIVRRIGRLLRNPSTGFVAALLAAFAYLPQELTAGAINTDHNDAVFIALVACSWWAWLECVRAPSWKWSTAVGLFAACAVLTKWYIGGCVFLPWGLWVMHGRFRWERLKWMLLALGITAMPLVTWLMYIAHRFPIEAAYETHENWLRWTTPLEGHDGPWWFHFDII